jgi:hypothetical protein
MIDESAAQSFLHEGNHDNGHNERRQDYEEIRAQVKRPVAFLAGDDIEEDDERERQANDAENAEVYGFLLTEPGVEGVDLREKSPAPADGHAYGQVIIHSNCNYDVPVLVYRNSYRLKRRLAREDTNHPSTHNSVRTTDMRGKKTHDLIISFPQIKNKTFKTK